MKNYQFSVIILSLFAYCSSTYSQTYDPNYMLKNSDFYLGSIIINSTYPNISYQIAKNNYPLFSNAKLKTVNNPLGKNVLAQLSLMGPQGAGISADDAKLTNDRLLDDKGMLKLNQSDISGIPLMGLELQYAGPSSSANNIIVKSTGDSSLETSATLFNYKLYQRLQQFAPVITQSTVAFGKKPMPTNAPRASFFLNLYFDPVSGEVHIDSIDGLVFVKITQEAIQEINQANQGQNNTGVMGLLLGGFAPQLIHLDNQALIANKQDLIDNIVVEIGD